MNIVGMWTLAQENQSIRPVVFTGLWGRLSVPYTVDANRILRALRSIVLSILMIMVYQKGQKAPKWSKLRVDVYI